MVEFNSFLSRWCEFHTGAVIYKNGVISAAE